MSKPQLVSSITEAAIAARRQARSRPKFDPTEIRLSESGGCPRQQLLRVTGAEETHPQPAEARLLMETGDVWERMVVESLIDYLGPDRVKMQVEILTPHDSHGHIDAVITLDDGNRRLVECKATKAGSRKFLPNERNVRQLQAYLHYYGRHHGITRGELIYVLRETGETVPFILTYDPRLGADIDREQKHLAALKVTGEVPDVASDMKADKFPCYYKTRDYEVHCPYHGHCWSAKGERRAPQQGAQASIFGS